GSYDHTDCGYDSGRDVHAREGYSLGHFHRIADAAQRWYCGGIVSWRGAAAGYGVARDPFGRAHFWREKTCAAGRSAWLKKNPPRRSWPIIMTAWRSCAAWTRKRKPAGARSGASANTNPAS